ncbi:MAG: hypothetical protein VX313_05085, partial [Bacteroidota bacterium]|nr:hypothetical protein [Bacteroidota bacterium]
MISNYTGSSRFVENIEKDTHDDAVVECEAEISDKVKSIKLQDQRRINFLKAYSYDNFVTANASSFMKDDEVLEWRQNGLLLPHLLGSKVEFRAKSTPGILQVLFYGSNQILKFVVCPSSHLLHLVFGVFSPLNLLLCIPMLWKMCSATDKTKIPKGESHKKSSNFRFHKRLKAEGSAHKRTSSLPRSNPSSPSHVKRCLKCLWQGIKNLATFVSQLCLLELVTTLSYFLHKDVAWGLTAAITLVIEYILRLGILTWFLGGQSKSFTPEVIVMACYRQAVPILKSYTNSSDSCKVAIIDVAAEQNSERGKSIPISTKQAAHS